MDGMVVYQLIGGEYDVINFYGLDEVNGMIYYQVVQCNLMQCEIYSYCIGIKVVFCCLVVELGINSVQFSSIFDYFVLIYFFINVLVIYMVMDCNGKVVWVIEDNVDLWNLQEVYGVMDVEFFNVKIIDNVSLNGYMIKFLFFNEKCVYFVLMYVYGGLGSQIVKDSWGG